MFSSSCDRDERSVANCAGVSTEMSNPVRNVLMSIDWRPNFRPDGWTLRTRTALTESGDLDDGVAVRDDSDSTLLVDDG